MKVMESFLLSDKVALVTGGTRGLGRAMAQALREAGATVVVTARSARSASATASELGEMGISSYGTSMDVRDRGEVEQAFDRIEANVGYVDVLVNNAGVCIGDAGLDVNDEDWGTVFATNLDGVWNSSRRAARTMSSRGGERLSILVQSRPLL